MTVCTVNKSFSVPIIGNKLTAASLFQCEHIEYFPPKIITVNMGCVSKDKAKTSSITSLVDQRSDCNFFLNNSYFCTGKKTSKESYCRRVYLRASAPPHFMFYYPPPRLPHFQGRDLVGMSESWRRSYLGSGKPGEPRLAQDQELRLPGEPACLLSIETFDGINMFL